MGRTYLRLAFADIGRRRLQTGLTVLVVAAATGTLALALSVGRVADRPWERTFEATSGAHVTVVSDADADLERAAKLPGVVGSTGVLRAVISAFRLGEKVYGIRLVGMRQDPPRVGRPLVVDGTWLRPGGVVLERSFARFHGLRVGDELVVGSGNVPLRIDGVALTTATGRYPDSQPGLAWAAPALLDRVQPADGPAFTAIGLRLADPAATDRIESAALALFPRGSVHVDDWRGARADALDPARTKRLVLETFSLLMLIAAAAILATLVGGRALAQLRELGLLKAIGFTPRQVATVFVLEQLALGLAGGLIGITVATLVTPAFVRASAALLGASETPSFDPASLALVLGGVLAAVALCTGLPAWRGARRTTAQALAGSGSPPRVGARRLASFARWLPVPASAAIGAREAFARPGRASLIVLGLALTVASAVATLGMEASLEVGTAPPPPRVAAGGLSVPQWDPVNGSTDDAAELRPVVYALDAALLALGLANLLAALLLGLREQTRDLGVLKTIGLTPRQLTASVVTATGLTGAAAALVGIPLGLLLFRVVIAADGASDSFVYPGWWRLALLVPATVGLVALVTALPARRAARASVVDALRYE